MPPKTDYFAQLSPSQKAELFRIYARNGIYKYTDVIDHYNKEVDRMKSSTDKNFVRRLNDPEDYPYIDNNDGSISTHRMRTGYDENGRNIMWPTIQQDKNGKLVDYGDTDDWGLENAIANNDTLQVNLPSLADYFGVNYKTHYPNVINNARAITSNNEMAEGGSLDNDDEANDSSNKTYEQTQDEFNAIRDRYLKAYKARESKQKEFYTRIEQIPGDIKYRNDWWWGKDRQLVRIKKERDMAEKEFDDAQEEYFKTRAAIGQATIDKYKGSTHDLLQYNRWSSSPEKTKGYLIGHGVRESRGAQEVADYFNSYAKSDGFNRIIENQAEWGLSRHPYRKILDPTNYSKSGYTRSARVLRDALRVTPMSKNGVFDMDGYSGMSFNWTQRNPYNHLVIVYGDNVLSEDDEDGFGYFGTLAHEMMHDYNFTGSGQGEALDQNTNTAPGHDSNKSEKHSDIEALRFLLFKEGIYDSRGNKDATSEDIKKLREKHPKFRPLLQMNDEKAAWMINHVASVDNKPNISNIVANGGNLYGPGGLLNNFKKLVATTYKTDTFGDAFRQARIDGKEYFKWNGKRYSTEMLPTEYVKDDKLKIQGVTKKKLETMQYVWDYLRNHNVSARNTAAVMGNIMQESSFDPSVRQVGGDYAVGLFQMHGKRLNDYNSYLKENELNDSMDNQLSYIIEVMKGNRKDYYMNEYNRVKNELDELESIKNPTVQQLNDLKNKRSYYDKIYGNRVKNNTLYPISDFTQAYDDETVSLEDLTSLFTNTIERAGSPQHKKRQEYARNIYNYFYGVPTVKKE